MNTELHNEEMSPDELKKKWRDMNTSDYNSMRQFISEIEMKLLQVDPERQMEFYTPLKNFIFEAWQDACNPDDSFLFPKPINSKP